MKMARTSRSVATNKRNKRSTIVKKVNPFELKFNRNKHKILGKGTKNVAVGAPTLSKKKAYDNRINSLAVELKQIGKSNKVVDRRLGEHDTHMTEEDRLIKRFTAERLKAFKTNKFQLAEVKDDEELTHKGSALTSIQKYERTLSDDEDADGEVDANMVSTTHFGGGIVEETDEKNSQKHAKRKDLIAALIAKTKQQRYDKQMARDEQEDTTERLDEQWKKLMNTGAMASFANVPGVKDKANKTSDEYDLLLCELKMDSGKRGEATERQKTTEEIARDEHLKLIQLEKARLARMEDQSIEKKSPLANGGVEDISSGKAKGRKRSGFEVRYDEEGRLIQPEKVKRARIKLIRIDNESDSENSESISDYMKSDEEEDFDSMLQQEDQLDSMESEAGITFEGSFQPSTDAMKETNLPYIFEMPSSYEKLSKLLQEHSASEVMTIVERLMKCYHPSLQEGNKKRLARLFLYLLRFYDDLSMNEGAAKIEILGVLISCLYSLLKFDVEYGMRCIRALLRQQWRTYIRDRHTVFGFRRLSIVRLVAALFPVSDFFHPVCTPTLMFAVNVVANVRVTCVRTAARILLLIVLLTEYIGEAKRFIPEVMAFMQGLLLMGVENTDEERSPTATFPISLPYRRMLFVENDCSDYEGSLTLKLRDIFDDNISSFNDTDENRLSVLRLAFGLLCKLVLLYSVHHYSFNAIFGPLGNLLKRLPSQRYPPTLRAELEEVQACIAAECEKNASLKQLQKPKQQKKMLEMLEPRFEENFNAEHSRKDSSKEGKKAEKRKLMRKYKKEMRGAVRELRKDNQFIAREKRREIEANDRIRRQKTKELMHSLQGQESEYKKNLYMKKTPRR